MTEMLETKKYTFTVEGETERWYLLWLRDRINEQEGKEYKVAIEPKVQQHPMKFAKGVNAISTPEVIHICDVESKTAIHVEKFRSILNELKAAKRKSIFRMVLVTAITRSSFGLYCTRKNVMVRLQTEHNI